MKKIIILLTISIFFAQFPKTYAFSSKHLDKEYMGIPFEQAINNNKPTILVFVSPKDINTIAKIYPLGKFIYNEYKEDFNFTILNSDKQINNIWLRKFLPEKLPSMYIIDAEENYYIHIDEKYYKKRLIKRILDNYKKGTLI